MALYTRAEPIYEERDGVVGDAVTIDTLAGALLAAGGIRDAHIDAAAAIAESKLALASDAAAGTASRRTLGTGATQACAGNDARLSDTRTPTDGSVTAAKVAAALKPSGSAAATDEALRRLGTGAGEAAPGVAAVGAVVYAGDARVARPTGYVVVFWIFPTGVTPANMAGTDVLIETA